MHIMIALLLKPGDLYVRIIFFPILFSSSYSGVFSSSLLLLLFFESGDRWRWVSYRYLPVGSRPRYACVWCVKMDDVDAYDQNINHRWLVKPGKCAIEEKANGVSLKVMKTQHKVRICTVELGVQITQSPLCGICHYCPSHLLPMHFICQNLFS